MKPRASTVAGALLALALLGAAPAVGSALTSEPGGQPPAGTKGVRPDVKNAGPEAQPPAGAPGVHSDAQNAGAEAQPANLHPQKPGKPTQLKNDEPDAKPHPDQVDHGTAVSGPDQGD